MSTENTIGGREAHFLIAYNTRLIAEDESTLKPAFFHLKQARCRLQKNVSRYEAGEYKKFELRFAAETLSLQLTRQLFIHYCDWPENALGKEDPWTLQQCIVEAACTAQALDDELNNSRENLHDESDARLSAIAGFSVACDHLTLSLLVPELLTDNDKTVCYSRFFTQIYWALSLATRKTGANWGLSLATRKTCANKFEPAGN